MRAMAEERRACDFVSDEEGEEADVESLMEDNSSELVDRLRELEAENSALVLANESQREAYERCLDEVANHVVQALLNQKDLREECIKLKMLVFDLERQNRALCELFQQKLPNHPTAPHYQVPTGPLPDYSTQLLHNNDSAAKQTTDNTHSEAQAKGNGYRTQHASPAASMEALSPFFKKKAHILEVLRKMEETDPLKFHPSTTSLSFCDYSQVLMSTEAVLSTTAEPPCKPKPHHTHCRCSCPDVENARARSQNVTNGDVVAPSCCSHCHKKSPTAESPTKTCGGGHVCSPPKSAQGHGVVVLPTVSNVKECKSVKSRTTESLPVSKLNTKNEANQQQAGATAPLETSDPILEEQDGRPANISIASEELTGFISLEEQEEEEEEEELVENDANNGVDHNGLAPVSNDNANLSVPEKDDKDENDSVRAGASISPSPASCLSDVRAAAINSPSKLLKFLKIPSIGDKSSQGSGANANANISANANAAPVRLSPQLTRSSRIPCRTNNYEVYHSPVPTRRATTTERCRQPPPPPARSESYPATHSAPTSPPQLPPDDCTLPGGDQGSFSGLHAPKTTTTTTSTGSKMAAPSSSSSSSPKVSQKVPHYENVCNMNTNVTTQAEQTHAHTHEKRKQQQLVLPTHAKANNGGERKLVKSLPESVLNPSIPQRKESTSSSASESSSDDENDEDDDDEEEEEEEEDSDSPVWANHHSLPHSNAFNKATNRANFLQAKEKQGESESVECSVVARQQQQHHQSAPPPPPIRRSESSSIPKRPVTITTGSTGSGSSHAFKDRLAALGKLRSSEDLQVASLKPVDSASDANSLAEEKSKTAERPPQVELLKDEQRLSKYSDSLDGKTKTNSVGLKYPGSAQLYEQPSSKTQTSKELKPEGFPKSRIGLPSPNADGPQVLRNNIRCPGSLNLPYSNLKQGGPITSNSPNKIPPKSPSKPCQITPHRSSSKSDAPRYSSKSEERTKLSGKGKKNPMFGDSLPPPPPKPPTDTPKQTVTAPPQATSPQSAIEQKVMQGIQENMLKEQDRVVHVGEVKQKSSNGIASWFGLKKSKLPALRKTDANTKASDKKEWKINIPSVGRDSVKMATRCKEGVEGLNISSLMEKAEGLRRALEEERAYVERSGSRGTSCEVVMDPTQGQLAVMYRGGRSDNFMQQLLNRVDGKEIISVPQRRLSFDCKSSKPLFSQQGDIMDMDKSSDRMGKITSDENLADSVHSQLFAGSGASTYTLDSGIGTFPLPDSSSSGGLLGRGGGGAKGRQGAGLHTSSPGRSGRRARTLEREMTPQEECYAAQHKQLIPTIQYGSSAGVREDKESHGANMFSSRSKTWTFPNLKAQAGPGGPAGQTDVYLAVEEEEDEEPGTFGSPYRASVKSVPSSSRCVSAGEHPGVSLPVPSQAPCVSRRGHKPRPPQNPADDALSPGRPGNVPETPESLSDSLYDSLSSCGSQG